jgi:hypothetical protein
MLRGQSFPDKIFHSHRTRISRPKGHDWFASTERPSSAHRFSWPREESLREQPLKIHFSDLDFTVTDQLWWSVERPWRHRRIENSA